MIKNAINLHDRRDHILKAFINKNICSGDVEKDVYYWDEESKIEKNVAERTKLIRQNQEGRLKILTPQQMLNRSAVSLAQFKPGNNSGKRKN